MIENMLIEMGTNYYARVEYDEVTHIGKSSFGWTFTFHATASIRSYKQWLKFLEDNDVKISDEYGEEISIDEFKELVESKRGSQNNHTKDCQYEYSYLDEEGNSMTLGEFS